MGLSNDPADPTAFPRTFRAYAPFLAFVVLYLAGAFLTRNDWGLTMDEPNVYLHGFDLGDYFSGRSDRMTGMDVESNHDNVLYCYAYPWFVSLFNPQGVPAQSHLLNLVFALPLFAASYALTLASGASPLLALGGPVFLLLSPRLLGNLPINPKDGPFAVGYLAAVAILALAPFRRRVTRVAAWSVLFGGAFCLRPLGATLPLLYLLDAWTARSQEGPGTEGIPRGKWILWETCLICVGGGLVAFLFWPILRSPEHWGWLLQSWAHYPHGSTELLWGGSFEASALPWFFFPGWILASTPVLFLALSLAGWLWVPASQRVWRTLWGALTLNLALLMAVRPVCYDSLRHFLFLLPFLPILAAVSLVFLWRRHESRRGWVAVALLLGLFFPVLETVRLHPYEYLYLNEAAGGFSRSAGRFPGDYWGASVKEGLDWLRLNALTDPHRTYRVRTDGCSGLTTLCYLPANARWAKPGEPCDYHAGFRPLPASEGGVLIHQVEREGVPLLWIYRCP